VRKNAINRGLTPLRFETGGEKVSAEIFELFIALKSMSKTDKFKHAGDYFAAPQTEK
jgi:hypothetical protein